MDFPTPGLGQRAPVLGDDGKVAVFEHRQYYPDSRF
jgi:hypothetical protein